MSPKYPDHLSASTTPPRHSKSRARRETSGVFSLFQAPQIQQFKEAFQLIDHDKDGWVTESDLKEIFTSLGISPTKKMLDDLLSARPGAAVTPHSRSSLSPQDNAELKEAFECFDEGDTGIVKVDEMRKWMGEVGERMDHQEIDKFLKGSFTDRQGNFNYREWIKVLRVNDDENAEPQS
ncbi:hypothetical protein BKA83DRAFT_392940 [Pisolithus microcarpus]|nr:hypothetical protein BKA83DRAFT_392940 [Pisolithus microcarpus]